MGAAKSLAFVPDMRGGLTPAQHAAYDAKRAKHTQAAKQIRALVVTYDDGNSLPLSEIPGTLDRHDGDLVEAMGLIGCALYDEIPLDAKALRRAMRLLAAVRYSLPCLVSTLTDAGVLARAKKKKGRA